MLERLLNWIKLRMPVSRREFDMKVRLLEETAHVDILSKTLDKVITETNGLYNRHNDLSTAVKTSNEESTERFQWLNKKLNDLTIAVSQPAPKKIINIDITEKEKRIVLSYISEKLHEIDDLRDLTHRDNFEDCQKIVNELETLINKFK